jgi:hypothetical protein
MYFISPVNTNHRTYHRLLFIKIVRGYSLTAVASGDSVRGKSVSDRTNGWRYVATIPDTEKTSVGWVGDSRRLRSFFTAVVRSGLNADPLQQPQFGGKQLAST